MQYEEIDKLNSQEAVDVFQKGIPGSIARALLGLAMYEHDLSFTQGWCLFFLGHTDDTIAGAAATALGHLARITRGIDKDVVIPALQIVRMQGRLCGRIQDALDDIEMFCS